MILTSSTYHISLNYVLCCFIQISILPTPILTKNRVYSPIQPIAPIVSSKYHFFINDDIYTRNPDHLIFCAIIEHKIKQYIKMKSFLKFISNFDAFWVAFTPNLLPNSNQTYYRTPLGGIVSIIIYLLWLIYSGNLLKQWINNSMVMTVSSQYESRDSNRYIEIFNNSNDAQNYEIAIMWNELDYTNIFEVDQIILIPILIDINLGQATNILQFQNETDQTLQISSQKRITIMNLFQFLFHVLEMKSCQILAKNVQPKIKLRSEIWMLHKTYTLDLYTKEIKIKESYTSITLQKSFAQYQEIRMQYTFTEIYSGMIFGENSSFMLKTSYVSTIQFTANRYLDTYFGFYTDPLRQNFKSVLGAIYLLADPSINHVIAQYPTISEILARIGSTLQTFLLLKYIFWHFNRKEMIRNFKEFCQTIYLPEISQITFEIENGQPKEKDKKEQKKRAKLIEHKLDEKLNYANLIYEISRIQILLSEVVNKQKIIESHYVNKSIHQLFLNQSQKPKNFQNFLNDNFLFSYSTGRELKIQTQQSLMRNNLMSQELLSQFSQAGPVNQELFPEDIQLSRSLRPRKSI